MSRHYQHWPGNNIFLCGGHIIMGSSYWMILPTIVLQIGPFAVFIIYVSPHLHWAYSLVTALLLFLSVGFFFLAAFTEPGIIPRCLPPHQPNFVPQPSEVNLDVDGSHLKFCDTCLLFRPQRAKHCRFCNNCILEFDHHCPWIGGCVGRRNYRWFFLFLTTLLILVTYAFGCVLTVLVERGIDRGEGDDDDDSPWWDRLRRSIQTRPGAFALGIFLAGVILSVFMLWIYHIMLISKGETTNEAIRQTFKRRLNPFTQGFRKNLVRIFSDIPPSQLDYLTMPISAHPTGIPGLAQTRDDMRRRRGYDAQSPTFQPTPPHLDIGAHSLLAASPSPSPSPSCSPVPQSPMSDPEDSLSGNGNGAGGSEESNMRELTVPLVAHTSRHGNTTNTKQKSTPLTMMNGGKHSHVVTVNDPKPPHTDHESVIVIVPSPSVPTPSSSSSSHLALPSAPRVTRIHFDDHRQYSAYQLDQQYEHENGTAEYLAGSHFNQTQKVDPTNPN